MFTAYHYRTQRAEAASLIKPRMQKHYRPFSVPNPLACHSWTLKVASMTWRTRSTQKGSVQSVTPQCFDGVHRCLTGFFTVASHTVHALFTLQNEPKLQSTDVLPILKKEMLQMLQFAASSFVFFLLNHWCPTHSSFGIVPILFAYSLHLKQFVVWLNGFSAI